MASIPCSFVSRQDTQQRLRCSSTQKAVQQMGETGFCEVPTKSTVPSQISYEPEMALFYKWIMLSNFSKRTKRIYRNQSHQWGDCLGGCCINLTHKKWWGKWLIQEDTAITSQWRTGSEDSRGIHCLALIPSESVRAGQRKENWKSVPPSD